MEVDNKEVDEVRPPRRVGEASIKSEYLILKKVTHKPSPTDTDVKKIKLGDDIQEPNGVSDKGDGDAPNGDGDQKQPGKRVSTKDKKKTKGMNHQRPVMGRTSAALKLCPRLKDVVEGDPPPVCSLPDCHFRHDVHQFLQQKPEDLSGVCPVFQATGRCPAGLSCRFAGSHTTADLRNACDAERWQRHLSSRPVRNQLTQDVQRPLWKRRYDFSATEAALIRHDKRPPLTADDRGRGRGGRGGRGRGGRAADGGRRGGSPAADSCPDPLEALADIKAGGEVCETAEKSDETCEASTEQLSSSTVGPTGAGTEPVAATAVSESAVCETSETVAAQVDVGTANSTESGPVFADVAEPASSVSNGAGGVETALLGSVSDEDLVKRLPADRTTVKWKDQLYLAPLTTVGNLPFRRLCRRLGADITCGEMAMAPALLQGARAEWALVKRHSSESLFGVQICGNNPGVLTRCTQLLNETCELDFIDINMGCPIDLVYHQGAGSALLRRRSLLESACRSMCDVSRVPITLKMRTGVQRDVNLAHHIIDAAADWGVQMITLHGRSREQRYTRRADWQYVEECARRAAPLPLFGNGDVLSWQEYQERRSGSSVAGIMVGRGALIKPWIFTEIKEQRTWDISSSERLDLLKEYVNYGLEHWGSDSEGVERTRRFLLEWLSFLYRYIPVGLLEEPPQRINERPPAFRGRDPLETLMASPDCRDWVKISEMVLGSVPAEFVFLPKHAANAY